MAKNNKKDKHNTTLTKVFNVLAAHGYKPVKDPNQKVKSTHKPTIQVLFKDYAIKDAKLTNSGKAVEFSNDSKTIYVPLAQQNRKPSASISKEKADNVFKAAKIQPTAEQLDCLYT